MDFLGRIPVQIKEVGGTIIWKIAEVNHCKTSGEFIRVFPVIKIEIALMRLLSFFFEENFREIPQNITRESAGGIPEPILEMLKVLYVRSLEKFLQYFLTIV